MIGGNPSSSLQPWPGPFVGSSTSLIQEFLLMLYGLVVVFTCLELFQERHIDIGIRTKRHRCSSLGVRAIRAIDNYPVDFGFWELVLALEETRLV